MMKLWEVIKELTEDPTKRFKAKMAPEGWTAQMSVSTGPSRYFKFAVFNGAKLLDQSRGGMAFNGNVALDLDWQSVRQPVTWEEAIQAWADGKRVTLKLDRCEYAFCGFSDQANTMRAINSGTWYVED